MAVASFFFSPSLRLAGAAGTAVTCPLEVVKTRLQVRVYHKTRSLPTATFVQTAVGQGLIQRYGLAAEAAGLGVTGLEGHMTTIPIPRGIVYAR